MHKRQYCEKCHYPQSVCLCNQVRGIDNKVRVIVLQHPSEVNVAKNTVRLLALSLKHIDVYVGETADDFQIAYAQCLEKRATTAVLYPSADSLALGRNRPTQLNIEQLILIDGTWRKAYKIWKLNPWLQDFICWHLDSPPKSQYLRKTRQEHALSTLEACSEALACLGQDHTASLLELQRIRQHLVTAKAKTKS
ncbi:DTW domain-containing protein [Aliiglaciecola sp. CAU 1673]|uniref:tRNA-uridine aminocarboxypropyltransferase n=1 Tax=Aliiglaciecola sp. CAU 1673 TaxID=3032595 RepID=UPI0023DA475E|nr:tRNA-uridine aminocarboxypropyltransferase [Aliiglaciecola sp. CAU 1673]MDF2179703.1 DTW domain-containing protein [Aliiglaciecola sp. CAU 1673]